MFMYGMWMVIGEGKHKHEAGFCAYTVLTEDTVNLSCE